MNDNSIALLVREKIKDYIIRSNGDISYDRWSLNDDMKHHTVQKVGSMEMIMPPNKSIRNPVYKGRNPGCGWTKNRNRSSRLMEWTNFEFSGEINLKKIILKQKLIKVPEFVNRFGYVS